MGMVETIILIVIATLLLMKIAPNFVSLKVGGHYKSRDGEIIRINHQIKVGEFDIFVSDYDIRYFSNGHRVGDLMKRSPFDLIKRVK